MSNGGSDPSVLNDDRFQWNHNCRTSQQRCSAIVPPSAPDIKWPTPLSHPKWRTFIRRPHNLFKEARELHARILDYETQVPPRTKKKRIVYGQHTSSTKQRSRQWYDNILTFERRKDLIDKLRRIIKEVHGMDPNYADVNLFCFYSLSPLPLYARYSLR